MDYGLHGNGLTVYTMRRGNLEAITDMVVCR